jgi:hypothetical protein
MFRENVYVVDDEILVESELPRLRSSFVPAQ